MGGWADCGTDRNGRPIGYAFEATCDEPGCEAEIDRGLSFACGDQHGEDVHCCERYFCGWHLFWVQLHETHGGGTSFVCRECLEELKQYVKEMEEV
jgi:hypothetical protein